MIQQKILIVEDEPSIIDILSYNLKNEGFKVITATDGRKGLKFARTAMPDLAILDLMLPVIDGLQVCRQLRDDPKTQHIRILMLTAKSEEVDEIVGFNMGADDYVTKPFKIKPLIHRIKALLRRPPTSSETGDAITLDGIEIDRANHTVHLNGQELFLTPTEFRLLWTLIGHPGRPFNRSELMDICRGDDANALERTIDVHIRSLRIKLGDQANPIETVHGVGYRFRTK